MTAQNQPMLQLKNVSKTFNRHTVTEKRALHKCNLTVDRGDFKIGRAHV